MPRYPQSDTAQTLAARRNRQRQIDEKLSLVALLSRIWPSHLCDPKPENDYWKHVVCIHSPGGQLAWKITDEELPLFAHLKRSRNDWDGHSAADKFARIDAMIALGW